MRYSSKFFIPALLALTVSVPAIAQQLPTLPRGSAPVPATSGNQVLQNVLAQNGQPPVSSGETQPVAPMPMQGEGGFGTSIGANDPAERMNLTGADGYRGDLTASSEKRLEALTGADLSDTASDLEAMMDSRRRIMLLGLRSEEAELAVGLWGTLYNNEHAQAFRQQERDDAAARKAAEEASNAARIATLSAQNQQTAISPVIFPVVYEVNGGTAILLVPGGGEIYARAGTDLQGGFKVVSVGAGGVVVEKGGQRTTLGFGTSVGPAPTASPQGAPAFQSNY